MNLVIALANPWPNQSKTKIFIEKVFLEDTRWFVLRITIKYSYPLPENKTMKPTQSVNVVLKVQTY